MDFLDRLFSRGPQRYGGAISGGGLPTPTPIAGYQDMPWPNTAGTLQNAAVSNGNGTISPDLTGYDGALILEIENGAGTATVTINGGFSTGLLVDQDTYTLGLILLSTTTATGATASTKATNTSRSIVSGVLSVAANTSYLYQIADTTKFVQAAISSASGLGAGLQKTGLSVKLYALSL